MTTMTIIEYTLTAFVIYIIPIFLIALVVYFDMGKGQTVKEYLDDMPISLIVFAFFPVYNYMILILVFAGVILALVENFKK
jgi:hypothetical protein